MSESRKNWNQYGEQGLIPELPPKTLKELATLWSRDHTLQEERTLLLLQIRDQGTEIRKLKEKLKRWHSSRTLGFLNGIAFATSLIGVVLSLLSGSTLSCLIGMVALCITMWVILFKNIETVDVD